MKSYASLTSDQGTEIGMTDFYCGGPDSLLPPWVDRQQPTLNDVEGDFENEGDGAVLDDALADVDGVCVGGASTVADALADVDGAIAVADDEEPVHVHDADECAHHQDHFLEDCLPFAGIQHITNGLCNVVHTSLAYWNKSFYNELKNLEALLVVDERRLHYVWSCLLGTIYAANEWMFKSFSTRLYEPRWKEVLKFLRVVSPMLSVRACTFDVAKYKACSIQRHEVDQPNQAFVRHQREEQQGLS